MVFTDSQKTILSLFSLPSVCCPKLSSGHYLGDAKHFIGLLIGNKDNCLVLSIYLLWAILRFYCVSILYIYIHLCRMYIYIWGSIMLTILLMCNLCYGHQKLFSGNIKFYHEHSTSTVQLPFLNLSLDIPLTFIIL